MSRRALVAALLALLAIAPARAQAGDPARDALGRLRAHEQRTRLQDLQTGSHRQLESLHLHTPGHPVAREPALERRWRAEYRQSDFRRDREREAIERRLDVEERLDRAARSTAGPSSTAPSDATASRDAFDRELADVTERERIERLRRDTLSRTGPGIRRWPLADPPHAHLDPAAP